MKEVQVQAQDFFSTPIWKCRIPEFLDQLIKDTDPYIKEADKAIKNHEDWKKREKLYGKKVGDWGMSRHSTSLYNDPKFEKFRDYVGTMSHDYLTANGYDLSKFNLHFTEMWVQEFAKKGGGHHNTHVHWNQHVSGFYFLKGSEKTSHPVFHDPIHGRQMARLPELDSHKVTRTNQSIRYAPIPGTLIIFPGYLPHEFVPVPGTEPFRFIHFNIQALPTVYCK